ncbi:MAG: exonuclease SbcCD subunit D [Anaerolineaceae bacterium]|nr:exonuclease SbcCD subunit D [Anaerolineaceae bacterium]
MKVFHFSDAHIDMANYGKRNPNTGLPYRVEDFLAALDFIIDAAIEEHADLVIFSGDAYKDRTPVPTYQREWGRRIKRLSEAGIPAILLVGNHDFSPAQGRAHTLQEFETLAIPNVRVISQPVFWKSEDLFGLPLQLIGLPWISRARVQSFQLGQEDESDLDESIEERITAVVNEWLSEADPQIPLILTAHASVQGAKYGRERTVMLGRDLVLSRALVSDPRIDYTALGHIHKPQNLNEGAHPPVIYPGSIERVDFGEAHDDKYFVVVELEKGTTQVDWRKLPGRTFIDRRVSVDENTINVTQTLINALPSQETMKDAIVRLIVDYPQGMEAQIEDLAISQYTEECFEFRFVRRPQMEARIRLPDDQTLASLAPIDLVALYLNTRHVDPGESAILLEMAKELLLEPSIEEEE